MIVEALTAVLLRLRGESALSIVLVEQNSHVALAFSARTVVMDKGRIVYDGESAALRADPETWPGSSEWRSTRPMRESFWYENKYQIQHHVAAGRVEARRLAPGPAQGEEQSRGRPTRLRLLQETTDREQNARSVSARVARHA